MDLTDAPRLLDPAPLPLEMGWERSADGVLHVATRTDMHGCTGEMFEWWFRWRCDTQKYVWWHPIDHVSSEWAGTLAPDTHVGSEHVVVERLGPIDATALVVQFEPPDAYVPADAYAAALEAKTVSCAVVGRVGVSHEPPRDPDGRVIGSRVLHVGRDTPWGLVLRTHFFLGQDLPALGMAPGDIEGLVPDDLGVALLQHAYNEFRYLARFLPSLFDGEHRDERPLTAPW